MNYIQAHQLRVQSKHLIGTVNSNGFVIGDIIIIPSENKYKCDFFASYLTSKDAELSIAPYSMLDLEVWAIDLDLMIKSHVLFYDKLDFGS